MTLSPKPGILDISPYVGGRSSAPGVAKVWKLSSNESPLGPSPKAVAALTAAAHDLEIYPDTAAWKLRDAIAQAYGLDVGRIVVGGEGSGPLLTMLANAYLRPGDEALFSQHAFALYDIATRANSATPVLAPEKRTNTGIKVDVDTLLKAVTQKTRLVFLANPNNPTGTYLPFSEIKRLHAGMPPHALLVLDAAYGEYVNRNDYSAGLELASACENVVMTRTFSKIHGLAALRIGWAYAPEPICDALNRIRGPFNLNAAAIAAGIAAIEDTAHVEMAAAHNAKWVPWVTQEISALGLQVTPSVANFVLIHFPQTHGRTAVDAELYLTARGLVLRNVGSYGLPHALRMTIGAEEANRLVVAALSDFVKQAE